MPLVAEAQLHTNSTAASSTTAASSRLQPTSLALRPPLSFLLSLFGSPLFFPRGSNDVVAATTAAAIAGVEGRGTGVEGLGAQPDGSWPIVPRTGPSAVRPSNFVGSGVSDKGLTQNAGGTLGTETAPSMKQSGRAVEVKWAQNGVLNGDHSHSSSPDLRADNRADVSPANLQMGGMVGTELNLSRKSSGMFVAIHLIWRIVTSVRTWLLVYLFIRWFRREMKRRESIFAFRERQCFSIMQVALYVTENIKELKRVEKRTLFEKRLSDVVLDSHARACLVAAAKQTTEAEPSVMMFVPRRDRWYILNLIQNQISTVTAMNYICFDQRQLECRVHFKSAWYILTLICHRSESRGRFLVTPSTVIEDPEDVSMLKIRAVLVHEKVIQGICNGEFRAPTKFFNDRHECRWRVLTAIARLYNAQFRSAVSSGSATAVTSYGPHPLLSPLIAANTPADCPRLSPDVTESPEYFNDGRCSVKGQKGSSSSLLSNRRIQHERAALNGDRNNGVDSIRQLEGSTNTAASLKASPATLSRQLRSYSWEGRRTQQLITEPLSSLADITGQQSKWESNESQPKQLVKGGNEHQKYHSATTRPQNQDTQMTNASGGSEQSLPTGDLLHACQSAGTFESSYTPPVAELDAPSLPTPLETSDGRAACGTSQGPINETATHPRYSEVDGTSAKAATLDMNTKPDPQPITLREDDDKKIGSTSDHNIGTSRQITTTTSTDLELPTQSLGSKVIGVAVPRDTNTRLGKSSTTSASLQPRRHQPLSVESSPTDSQHQPLSSADRQDIANPNSADASKESDSKGDGHCVDVSIASSTNLVSSSSQYRTPISVHSISPNYPNSPASTPKQLSPDTVLRAGDHSMPIASSSNVSLEELTDLDNAAIASQIATPSILLTTDIASVGIHTGLPHYPTVRQQSYVSNQRTQPSLSPFKPAAFEQAPIGHNQIKQTPQQDRIGSAAATSITSQRVAAASHPTGQLNHCGPPAAGCPSIARTPTCVSLLPHVTPRNFQVKSRLLKSSSTNGDNPPTNKPPSISAVTTANSMHQRHHSGSHHLHSFQSHSLHSAGHHNRHSHHAPLHPTNANTYQSQGLYSSAHHQSPSTSNQSLQASQKHQHQVPIFNTTANFGTAGGQHLGGVTPHLVGVNMAQHQHPNSHSSLGCFGGDDVPIVGSVTPEDLGYPEGYSVRALRQLQASDLFAKVASSLSDGRLLQGLLNAVANALLSLGFWDGGRPGLGIEVIKAEAAFKDCKGYHQQILKPSLISHRGSAASSQASMQDLTYHEAQSGVRLYDDAGCADSQWSAENTCCRIHMPFPTLKTKVDSEEIQEMRREEEFVLFRIGGD